jgi:exopolyphosphatase/guanosine-5'-triphosphate,3'-diphosphate pyrophosphatase
VQGNTTLKDPETGAEPALEGGSSDANAGLSVLEPLAVEAVVITRPAAAAIEPGSGLKSGRAEEKRSKRSRRRRRGKAVAPKPVVVDRAPAPPWMPIRAYGDAASALYAALDLGTNNCRLLIATPTRPGRFRVVDAFSRIVRLGEGFGVSGRLGEDGMRRAVEALRVCRDKLGGHQLRSSRLIATEACRSAENGAEFLARVERETGLDLEIVDRETEARLAVSGCDTLVERDTDAVVVFDIGGGSSEIALLDLSARRSPRLADHIVAWTSLPVGVVTLAERFGGRHVTPADFAAMTDFVAAMIGGFAGRGQLGRLAGGSRFHLLGTSGTVTTLAGIHLGLARYDRRRVDGIWLSSDEVTFVTRTLLSWEFEQRVASPCIGADRADLVLAGCAILEAIREAWPSQRLRVADRGLREGILTELMSHDGAWRNWRRRIPDGESQ